MELWQEVIVNKWRRLDNGEVMGYEVARKARELADFFESLNFMYYDTYGTRNFSSYVESAIRGYQANEQAYDDMRSFPPCGLVLFLIFSGFLFLIFS